MSFAYHLDGTALCKEVVNHVLFPVEGDVIIFKPHLTAGGGDCAMHALCGEVSNGIYYLHNPREYLMQCFEGDFDLVNAKLNTADTEGHFWPYVQRFIWKELFLESIGKPEAALF